MLLRQYEMLTLIGLYEIISKVISTRKGVMPLVFQLKTSASIVEYSTCFVFGAQGNGKLL